MATKKELETKLKRACYDRDRYNKQMTEAISNTSTIISQSFRDGQDSVRRDNYVIPRFDYDPNYNGLHCCATIIVVLYALISFTYGLVAGLDCDSGSRCTIEPDRVITTYNPAYRLAFALTKPFDKD